MSRIRAALAALELDDAFYFGGLALVSYGAWRAYAPAGPIVAGLGLLYLATRGGGD